MARLTGVLDVKVPEARQRVYDRNATGSPLLCLPLEIRNNIWRMALSNQTIHVRGHTSRGAPRIGHVVCHEAMDDRDFAAQIIAQDAKDEDPVWTQNYTEHHRHCHVHWAGTDASHPKSLLPVALLRTCRQIHQEAALLPCQEDIFSFWTMGEMGQFLKSLVPAQVHAIERITLRLNGSYVATTFEKLIQSKLKGLVGLKELLCFVPLMQTKQGKTDFVESSTRRHCAMSLMQFRGLPKVSAVVVTSRVFVTDEQLVGCSDVFNAMAREWAKEVEEGIMGCT